MDWICQKYERLIHNEHLSVINVQNNASQAALGWTDTLKRRKEGEKEKQAGLVPGCPWRERECQRPCSLHLTSNGRLAG